MSGRAVASSIENIAHMAAYVDAFERTLADIDISVVLVRLPDFCPPESLPFLAQDNDVMGYKGYALCQTDEDRRALIKAAPALKRLSGTPDSIERAIKAVGFSDAIVTEREGIKYNGRYKYDGSKKYKGTKWYNISVEVFYSGEAPDATRQSLVAKLIDIYKAKRSVLFDLKFTQV